jgi:Spy/CpxP family protein refolding chaperone
MAAVSFPMGLIHPREILMTKFSYVLAALAVTALTVPSIASAEDAKPGMMKEGMHKEMHGKPMMVVHHHHHHHYHHHMMKKEM